MCIQYLSLPAMLQDHVVLILLINDDGYTPRPTSMFLACPSPSLAQVTTLRSQAITCALTYDSGVAIRYQAARFIVMSTGASPAQDQKWCKPCDTDLVADC